MKPRKKSFHENKAPFMRKQNTLYTKNTLQILFNILVKTNSSRILIHVYFNEEKN